MRRTGLGLPNGCHMSYSIINKHELYGPTITTIYYKMGLDSELSKIIRFVFQKLDYYKIEFENIIIINKIKIPFTPWCTRDVAECYKTILDYLRDSIVLCTVDFKIEFIGGNDRQPPTYFKAFFLELIGFRKLDLIDVSKSKMPYLYVSPKSDRLLEEILKLEYN